MKTNANLVALSVDEQVETNGGAMGLGALALLVIVALLVSGDTKQEETVPPESNE